MVTRDEAALTAHVAGRPGAVVLALHEAGDPGAAARAMRSAADAVRRIPHPAEPGEPLPAMALSEIVGGVPALRIDLDDAGRAAEVVATILRALDVAGVDGHLRPVRPAPVFDHDADAEILTGVAFLDELDERGLPPVFPPGFPVPAGGRLVLAQRSRTDTWQFAAWRRDRPFDDYPDVLRAFGCDLDPVTARDHLMTRTGMSRWLLRHPAGTGSVSTFHDMDEGTRWYAGVVWRPVSGRPG